jgi:hypothetical protein
MIRCDFQFLIDSNSEQSSRLPWNLLPVSNFQFDRLEELPSSITHGIGDVRRHALFRQI